MKHQIFFSVVVPLYNKEGFILRAVQSVLSQSFSAFEIIVIDDGSTDGSREVVERLADSRIRVVTQANGGPSKARNVGIRCAEGLFIAFLDADDEWLPGKLEAHYRLHISYPELVWSCSGFLISCGGKTQSLSYSQSGVLQNSILAISSGLSVWTSTVVVRRVIFERMELIFNESVSRSEDRELWYKMACHFPQLGYIKKHLAIYHIGIGSGLTNTAISSSDYSFLTIQERIEDELELLEPETRAAFISYIDKFNKRAMLNVWSSSKREVIDIEKFCLVYGQRRAKILRNLAILPAFIKKVFSRTLVRTFLRK